MKTLARILIALVLILASSLAVIYIQTKDSVDYPLIGRTILMIGSRTLRGEEITCLDFEREIWTRMPSCRE